MKQPYPIPPGIQRLDASPSGWRTHTIPETPEKNDFQSVYHAARQEWNERHGDYTSRERFWRTGCFLALGIALLSTGGLVWSSSRSHLVPYVVEVDKLGAPLAIQRADVAAQADHRIIRTELARWIVNVRSVYQDAGAVRVNITDAYSKLRRNDPAHHRLNEFLSRKENDPFERGAKEGVSIEIHSVLPISDDTWQVQWTEHIHSPKGDLLQSIPMEANLTILQDPPDTEAGMLHNPLGIYIKNYNWSQRL